MEAQMSRPLSVSEQRRRWREWARTVHIEVRDFPPDVPQPVARHRYTNYEDLIRQIPDDLIGVTVGSECYWRLKTRTNALIESRRERL